MELVYQGISSESQHTKAGTPSSRKETEFLKLSRQWLSYHFHRATPGEVQTLNPPPPFVVLADHPFSRQGCFHTLLTHPAVSVVLPPRGDIQISQALGQEHQVIQKCASQL